MAKKSRNSTRSTRKHKGGGGGDAAWKHSPLVGGALAVVILICVIMIVRTMFGVGGADSVLPDDFPHAYLAEEDNGNYDAILIKRGSKSIQAPFTENGKEYWDAYVCHNEACPGRGPAKKGSKEGGRPYIFAGKHAPMPEPPAEGGEGQEAPPPDMAMTQIVCPKCKAAYDKASPKKKAAFDLTMVEHYQTEEALKKLQEIRDEFRKRSGGS